MPQIIRDKNGDLRVIIPTDKNQLTERIEFYYEAKTQKLTYTFFWNSADDYNYQSAYYLQLYGIVTPKRRQELQQIVSWPEKESTSVSFQHLRGHDIMEFVLGIDRIHSHDPRMQDMDGNKKHLHIHYQQETTNPVQTIRDVIQLLNECQDQLLKDPQRLQRLLIVNYILTHQGLDLTNPNFPLPLNRLTLDMLIAIVTPQERNQVHDLRDKNDHAVLNKKVISLTLEEFNAAYNEFTEAEALALAEKQKAAERTQRCRFFTAVAVAGAATAVIATYTLRGRSF